MLTVSGLDELIAVLEAAPARLEAAQADALKAGALLMQAEARRLLDLRSHSKGTRTPSPAGSPPARISGDLLGSVEAQPVGVSGAVATVTVKTGLVYSHIQEFGGDAGRGHRSHLPARPYMKPAMDTVAPAVVAALGRAWLAALTA